jgi:hypothetical protein
MKSKIVFDAFNADYKYELRRSVKNTNRTRHVQLLLQTVETRDWHPKFKI